MDPELATPKMVPSGKWKGKSDVFILQAIGYLRNFGSDSGKGLVYLVMATAVPEFKRNQ